ncbi:TetR/AcrR family transcriptional regulator [Oceanicoccus sp. KOV_DT_Chl]|uniref:TetR/AcrR family transcriptional regulator n=1 Tax=Oceanicoccus sp. KOV_DT_Chl TaxID=1904639 RepID=UPI000C7CE28D|nr:TetR/AcrR family transcriptional regulator [Oceanicoccus sp. KOV_DT_Chl]
MTTTKDKKLGKGPLKRAATEAKILKAFERVLKRDGIAHVGVNAIVKEAGVGKGLIYEYFGGLEGLADAWVAQSHFIPDVEEIIGSPMAEFQQQSIQQQLKAVHINYATMIKDNWLAQQIFAEELQPNNKLSKIAEYVRNQIGKTHEEIFTSATPLQDEDHIALLFIIHAASNYLALRAKQSPTFNGIDISTDEGWDSLMKMMSTVIDIFEKGKSKS